MFCFKISLQAWCTGFLCNGVRLNPSAGTSAAKPISVCSGMTEFDFHINILVGGLEHDLYFPILIGNI